MKKTILLFSFFIVSLCGFSQTCNKITFNYDNNGNQIQRQLVVYSCGGGERAEQKPATPGFPISVYPNPTMDKLNIGLQADTAASAKESTVQLIDGNGRIVYTTVTTALQNQLDMSSLADGLYILKITRGKKVATYNVKKTS